MKDRPSFPIDDSYERECLERRERYLLTNGLTKLEYFAGLALHGCISQYDLSKTHIKDVVEVSIKTAKALITELEKEQGE